MRNKTIMTCCRVLLMLIALALSALAQGKKNPLPPLPGPEIERVAANAKWQIHVTNAGSGQPIEITAKLYQSAHAYGGGLMKFKNVSSKNILTFRGEWIVKSAHGAVAKNGWNYGSATAVFWSEATIQPGKEIELPVGGPIAEIFGAPDRIQEITVRITGVAFSDKSYWGEDGDSRSDIVMQDAKSWLLVFERVKALCRSQRPEAVINALTKPEPGIFLDYKRQAFFKWLLLDKQNNLRPDGMQKLDQMFDQLKAFCS